MLISCVKLDHALYLINYSIYSEYMVRIDMNKNTVTRNFQHKKFANEINANYGNDIFLQFLHFLSIASRLSVNL